MSNMVFSQEKGQWSVEKANKWYKKQAWILGCNYVPSTAVNDVEMWQAETFDPATIDRELGWAKKWGINSVRVFLNYVVWEADAQGYIKRFEQFLGIAAKHGISVMPVLFDDCNFSGGIATIGKQPEPEPGVVMGGWVSSPPRALRDDPASFPKLKAYVQGIVKPFGKDKRIIAWDLYNEPYNNFNFEPQGETHPLMEQTFVWVCVICTEWMSRPGGSTAVSILPILKEKNVGGYLWGLVNGRTQTNFEWGSTAANPKGDPWKHDLMHKDGTSYDPAEFELFKKLSERKK
ncbi:hypothetical protein AGMMS49965_23660 [Bacteroidia bacterium]|nr:hypothetical protein AGMMS49965_23660 [Bacteroidia bacterium]